jgi:tol-pal system protein YbgF
MHSLAIIRRATRLAVGVSFLLMPFATHAGIFDDDEARKAILDLRQQITSLNGAVNNNLNVVQQRHAEAQQRTADDLAQMRKSMFELQNQIDRQKGDISQLRGDNEVLARNLSDMQIRQKDMLQSAEQKLQAVELRAQAVEQRSQAVEQKLIKLDPVKVTLDDREFMVDPNEKRDFDAAFALFRTGDFVRSQKALFDFIQRYSGSGYAPSALYWLGNAQYSNRDYKEAIINFRSLIAKNPDHIRAPEAMLSIANCQLEMKDPKSAKKTLEDLIKTYPKSEAAFAGVERLRILK